MGVTENLIIVNLQNAITCDQYLNNCHIYVSLTIVYLRDWLPPHTVIGSIRFTIFLIAPDKYQDLFFEHCAQSYASSTRSTQLAILNSIARVLEQLAILRNVGEPMETDNVAVTDRGKAISKVTDQVAKVVDYTLSECTYLLFIKSHCVYDVRETREANYKLAFITINSWDCARGTEICTLSRREVIFLLLTRRVRFEGKCYQRNTGHRDHLKSLDDERSVG